ncbi:cupin domain-containing protein [Actinomadura rudentiformis]|uniref:Cupin domain-containing protein n=1 Tax=Actinomadura rudentiformis TaxID=359158 RepID=A0A6H9Y9L6_9ACTN|nr:cupin domain-containing protein [Actinomadura rudentiformis]KAB2339352.1 cupin domain-containing protein [Actinomadura rudentiformis]
MTLIRNAEARRTETSAAVMTTFASPTQGEASLSVWRVDSAAGSAGPDHLIDAEQVWTFLKGTATVRLDGETLSVAAGDTVVMPADVVRQVSAGSEGFTAVVAAPAGAQASMPGSADKMLPPWIA